MTSPNKFNVNGPPKLDIHNINHIVANDGKILSVPLFIISLREWDRSYIILAQANIPDEQIPWAIMTIIPPVNPAIKADKKLTIIMAIWTTEEYAMITFISLKVKHAIPKIIPPNNLNIIKNLRILYTPVIAIMRIIP